MAFGLGSLRDHFLARRHTALLVAIVMAFAVRPLIGDVGVSPFVFSSAFLTSIPPALSTIQVDDLVGERRALLIQRSRRRIVGWALAVLATAERLATLFAPSPRLYPLSSIWCVLCLSFCA